MKVYGRISEDKDESQAGCCWELESANRVILWLSVSTWPSHLCSVHISASFSSVLARFLCLLILHVAPVASQTPLIVTGCVFLVTHWWEKSDWSSLSELGHMNHRLLLSQCIGSFLVNCSSMIQSVMAHEVRFTWEARTISFRPVGREGFLEKSRNI